MLTRASATAAIAIVTAIAGAVLILSDMVGYAAVYAGFIPARIGDALPLLDQSDLLPVWLTPFSATLVHASLFHLGFNLLMLGYTGMAAERALGTKGIVVLYLVGAIGAVAAQWLIDPASAVPMIGASGAISAIVGAYSLLYSRNRTRAIGPVSARAVQIIWLVAAWTAINLLVTFISAGTDMPVAGAAHVGGFIVGVALARPLIRWQWRHA
ncbi:rhomboid family intramembrane serine protease [Sphingomonas spermidinifaciens]|uniref:Rhomboid family intramembrane serine protease n=1 Tax=Sphingomonas spermidinifaciens TaxID=1141889 RepID=A0A2A4B5R9_9SPHN|nr:rhomboid family intramembrane serine protease [Sphingomonas spermidinifaciens]PCD02986.1 rhomboid family intramembrane serine protease [Sphingomonas spermidinifaciens]